jgi:hypothetical protein
MTYPETAAPVAYPRDDKSFGIDGTDASRRYPTLLRTPVSWGSLPVSIETCDGSVSGTCAYALSNTMLSEARPSIAGVFSFVT